GLMERAERMILLGAGFLAPWLLVPVLWILLGLTLVTAVGRFVRVWRAAEGPARPASPVGARAEDPITPRWRKGRVESRWRAWREGTSPRRSADRVGSPVARLRARRQEAMASRTHRARRARRSARERDDRGARVRAGRTTASRGFGAGRRRD
ncbi:MAG TPA: hypothetical protein VMB82_10220, partial [Acidimicrobiales bacterium]|nr:hypothetical protein [Acidimicrobiales bacterium]